MADLSRHPKARFFFSLSAKRICVWSMYQTSLSLSGTKSPLTLALSKSSVLPLAAWLMTFIRMEMGEEEEKAFDTDLDTYIHLRQADLK